MKEKKPVSKKTTKLPRPTDSELAILEILKDLRTGTVRQILKRHNQIYEAQAGYTTILKIIQIMTEKGLVEKDSSQRPQVYKPRLSWKKNPADAFKRFDGEGFQRVGQRAGPRSLINKGGFRRRS